MAQQHLDRAQIGAGFEQVSRIAVPQGVRRDVLGDAGSLECRLEIDAGELARVERRSLLGVAEDELILALEGSLAPALGEQGLRAWPELDHPARGARLGGREAALDERLSDSDLSFE